MMNNNELQLLRGMPIPLKHICSLYPLKIDDIAHIGHDEFNTILSYILFEDKDIKFNDEITISSFEYMLISAIKRMDDGIQFENCIEIVTKEKPTPHMDGFFFFGDISEGRYLDYEEFKSFKEIIKKQYFISNEAHEKPMNPANDKARELMEKMAKIKEKLTKENMEKGLDLSDIISIVAAYTPNLNLINVWELTVFQLYHLYIRLIMKDVYESEFQKYLQGEDPKKLNLSHWATKLNNKI